jgi:SAM-dependent methyltransferase
MNCRFCGRLLSQVFIDLGAAPPSNSLLTEEQLNEPELYYPLKVYVCHECFLVQIDEYKKSKEIFSDDYVYYSSTSRTWLEHSEDYAETIIKRLGLHKRSMVIEVASNDGYLLQYFLRRQIPVLGIEPTAGTARVAREKGIPVVGEFFTTELAHKLRNEGQLADLVVGNNVLAHVPDINDFVEGLKVILKPKGTITMEFPHLMQLIENNQFDTIYHEHYSYLSLGTAQSVFDAHGLMLYDVEELSTHGGSLRLYASHFDNQHLPVNDRVQSLLRREEKVGMRLPDFYLGFKDQVTKVKLDFLKFILGARRNGKRVAAYGAAAKGNTFLNFCGVKNDLIDFVVDAAPSKQGKYLPGSHIPVVTETTLKKKKPDFVVILPWNITEEIAAQLIYIRDWGGQFVVAIPRLKVHPA